MLNMLKCLEIENEIAGNKAQWVLPLQAWPSVGHLEPTVEADFPKLFFDLYINLRLHSHTHT